MRYIQFETKTMSVAVTEAELPGGLNMPVCEGDIVRDNPYCSRIPMLSTVYNHVIYPDREAEDQARGLERQYLLAPPDPWLVALGALMWEAIIQGWTWDTAKRFVDTALEKLTKEGVAPPSDNHQTTKTESLELGWKWVKYRNGKKLEEMFFGLRKHHESQIKPADKKKTSQ